MTDNNISSPAPEGAVNPEVLKQELTLSLSKEGLAYQQLLQDAENVAFTKDNLNDERTALTSLRKVQKSLKDMENPFTARWKQWNEARKSLLDPVEETLNKKVNEFKKLAIEVENDKKKADAEAERVKGIKDSIDNFFVEQSNAIAAAKDPQELVRIEKLIGSHRRAARYEGFYDEMDAKAANLTDLIKSQKESLKQLQALKSAENAANEAGDDQAVLDAREAQEQISTKIEETRINVVEKSVGMAQSSGGGYTPTFSPAAPKARRSSWKWEMVDEKAATRNGYTKVVPDEAKIDEYFKSVDKKGISEDGFTQFGIKIYLEKSY